MTNDTTLAIQGIQGRLNTLARVFVDDRTALDFIFVGEAKSVQLLTHPAALGSILQALWKVQHRSLRYTLIGFV